LGLAEMVHVRFGLALQNYVAPGESISPRALVEHATKAEELGYSSVWVWDHILLGSKSVFPVHDSLTILTAVAASTKHVRLGTGILVLSTRNPVVLAKQVATLDNLSEGRVTLGVAAGWYEREFQACGYPFDSRGRTLQTNLQVMKRLWTENNLNGTIDQYTFKNVTMEPKPTQKPHPPLWMGGYIDTVLRRVGRIADGWISYFYTPESFANSWRKVLDSAQTAGKTTSTFGNCDMVPVRIGDSQPNAKRVVTEYTAKHCDLPAWSEATPNSAITGTSKDCTEMIERFAEAGVQELVLIPAVNQLGEIEEQVGRVGKEVLQAFL
jgi:probable F420-dependent oxidoreductase